MILDWAKITKLCQDFTWCLSHNGMLFSFSNSIMFFQYFIAVLQDLMFTEKQQLKLNYFLLCT